LGLAAIIAILAGVAQVFLLGKPLNCDTNFFPPNKCVEEPTRINAKVVESITWNQLRKGLEKVDKRIAHSDQVDFCFLTRVTGKFEGGGEFVEVVRKADGWWHLRGKSHQVGVGGSAICMKLELATEGLPSR